MASLSDFIDAYQPAEAANELNTHRPNYSKRKKQNRIESTVEKQNNSYEGANINASVNSRCNRKRRREQPAKGDSDIKDQQTHEQEKNGVEVEYDFDWLGRSNNNHHVDTKKKMDDFQKSYSEAVRALYSSHPQRDESSLMQHKSVDSTLKQERDRLNSLYIIENAIHPQGLEKTAPKGGIDGTGYSNSITGRYLPRRKRVRMRPGDSIVVYRHNPELHYRLEKQEEVEDRVRRRQLVDTNRMIRMRWKRRVVTFQEEEDVGGAFAARAELHLADTLRREKISSRGKEQGSKRRAATEQKKKGEQEAIKYKILDELEEEDSVREQNQLLAQLSQTVSTNPDDARERREEGNNFEPKEMDFWQYGHVKPRSKDLPFEFKTSVNELVEQISAEILPDGEERREDGNEVNGTFREVTTSVALNERDRLYFSPNLTSVTNAKTTFRPGYKLSSARQFLAMACRVLCYGPSGNVTLENRYIRLLCVHAQGLNVKREEDATLSNFRIGRFSTMFSEQLGQSLFLFVKNSWTDVFKAAQQLGLLDSRQESPLADTTISSVQTSFKRVRVKTRTSFQKSCVKWSYENSSRQDAYHPDASRTFGIDAPTSGGFFEEVTQASDSAATIDRSVLTKLSNDSRGILIKANCLYSHIEGTKPPLPQFPLDPTDILFGPVDKHANFHHASIRMEHGVYKLILSTLLTRVANDRNKSEFESRKHTSNQVSMLAGEFVGGNENKLHERDERWGHEDSDGEERCLCNVMGNLSTDRWLPESDMKRVAGSVWDVCKTKIKHNGLLRFPKLRITFAIASICRILPTTAAEILSRPLDDDTNRSPIHLFKNTLEHMEAFKMLIDNTTSMEIHSQESLAVAELEYIIHDASGLIRESIVLDPVNVEYHLWHIGCLSSCLVLSSGNKISPQAYIYPSQKKGSFLFNKGPLHEVRTKLKKYDDVRLEVAAAFKSLLTLARHQSSAQAHFAVSTVLEWTQLMGLLVGSRMKDSLDNIVKLHSYHTQQWLLKETSPLVMKYIRKAEETRDVFIISRALERNPSDLSCWRSLVRCLGPLRKQGTANDIEKCCFQFRRVGLPRRMDHNQTIDERSLGFWWGEGREWWEDSILSFPPSPLNEAVPEKRRLVKRVLKRLRQEYHCDAFSTNDTVTPCTSKSKVHDEAHAWLPRTEDVQPKGQDQDSIPENERSTCYAAHLPKSLERLGQASHCKEVGPKSNVANFPCLSSALKEIKAYKVFVSCHMFGPDRPKVKDHIYNEFIRNCYKNTTCVSWMKSHCDELIILKWFNSMGLNLEAAFKQLCSERGIQASKCRLTNEEVGTGIQTSVSTTAENQLRREMPSSALENNLRGCAKNGSSSPRLMSIRDFDSSGDYQGSSSSVGS
ncbi:hypothetical protein IV203_008467 [Nitzschia inconspicua]|uniref:Uncharacterized protein n=1 Tax=Nitzschia inconspicua TaxID=303405 RepID=A0A9K3KZP2_9STRA|nr:hypothetical protein IV203_008467 [Nitzschia inconspicua]